MNEEKPKISQEAFESRKQGRIKIFLGMSAGVGKTYAMLEAAQQKKKEGIDLILATINTHGRQETAKLLEGLTLIPEKTIVYKDKSFRELDLDTVLKIKSPLVLVDEFAHSNIPGSRNEKRWQDILEIVEEGSEVYTTLNIQHVESYQDIIEGITGIRIWETVPDNVIEQADIELVDITPQELLKRLKEGKVYTGELSKIAAKNFFQIDRLTALRELSLRFVAEIVDKELHKIFALQKRKEWHPTERLLVGIDHKIHSQFLIRVGRRRAFALHAPWIVLYVDNGRSLDDEEHAMLSKNLALARKLEAEVITTKDMDIAQGILRIAEQKKITQILIGKPTKKIFKRSLVHRLLKEDSRIDLQVIRKSPPFLSEKKKKKIIIAQKIFPYFNICFWTGVIGILCRLLTSYIKYQIIGFIFLLTILIFSLFFQIGPLFLSASIFALIWDFFFIPPLHTFYISEPENLALLLLFFITALITSSTTSHIRKRQKLLIKKEQATEAIYDITRQFASAHSSEEMINIFKEKVGATLNGIIEVIVKKNGLNFDEKLSIKDEKEQAVASWVFKNNKEAGWSTSTLSEAKNWYIPLKGSKTVVGVLAFYPLHHKPLLFEETNFLYTVSQQLANYLERNFLEDRERENKNLQQIEEIYEKVLHSVSHELHDPLKAIDDAILHLKNEKNVSENPKLLTAFRSIEASTENLLRVMKNAAAMAQLSGGFIKFQKIENEIPLLIQSCTKKLESFLKGRELISKIQDDLPKISFDFSLMEILLYHLLINAIQYSPPGSDIELEAELLDGSFFLSVSDHGPGIPQQLIPFIFEKFYRLPGTRSPGLGLGLPIASFIAKIHNGKIGVQNIPSGGAKFFLILPLS